MSAALTIKSFEDLIPPHLRPKKKTLKKHRHDGHTFSRQEDILHYEAIRHIKTAYPRVRIQSNHLAGKSFKMTGKKKNPILRNVSALNGSKGMPDIILFKRTNQFSGLCLELKKPGGKVSKEEKDTLINLAGEGFLCAVIGNKCLSMLEAIAEVRKIIDNYFKEDFSNV